MTFVGRAAVSASVAALISGAAISTAAGAASDASSPGRMTAVLRSETSDMTVRGRFYARVARHGGDRAQLHFNVTYTQTGTSFRWPYPGIAHIHLGRPTHPGRVVITLCRASNGCGFRLIWSESFASDLVGRMRARGAYVEMHPRQNPETDTLRGRIVFR